MAITRVGLIKATEFSSAALTYVLTVGAGGVGLGHFIVVRGGINTDTGIITGITDSKGNTYTVDINQNSASHVVTAFVGSAYATTALVNGDTITITCNTSVVSYCLATEFSGLANSSWFDQKAGAQQAFATSWTTGSTPTTTVANELLIGMFVGTGNETNTPTGTFAGGGEDNLWGTGTGLMLMTSYAIVSATGAYACTGTISAADYGATAITTYNPFVGGGGPSPNPPQANLQFPLTFPAYNHRNGAF
jgi:hypothetical protein